IAVALHGTAAASVQPPAAASVGSGSDAGLPGMAAAVAVTGQGAASASSRTGDQGGHVGAAAAGPVAVDGAGSTASARSGSSGTSLAVALTVAGSAATSARSGDTGEATSSVSGPPATGVVSAGTALPGAGGTADANAATGDTGDALSWTRGATGAQSDAATGSTGDAAAAATTGRGGTDWTDGTVPGGDPLAVGGTGGGAVAEAATGSTGSSLSLVVSAGSAVASSSSGDTGSAQAIASGGAGGDVQVAVGGLPVATGDGGSARASGGSGSTGDAVSVLVTPALYGEARARSGSAGGAVMTAQGGDAGCAASGVRLDRACAATPPGSSGDSAGASSGTSDSSSENSSDKPSEKPVKPSVQPPVTPSPRPAPVVVRASSASSKDVVCTAMSTSRRCAGADTPLASGAVVPAVMSRSASATTAIQPVVLAAPRLPVAAAPLESVLAGTAPVRAAYTAADGTGQPSRGTDLLGVLVNAGSAVMVVALLITGAAGLRKRRRAGRASRTVRGAGPAGRRPHENRTRTARGPVR
ncbi:MAG: hypothetical protein ACTHOD_20940, partial [Motilibacteraceae bacterium]